MFVNKRKRELPLFTREMLEKVIGPWQTALFFDEEVELDIKITAKNFGKTFPEIVWVLYNFCNDPLFNAMWLRKYYKQCSMLFNELTRAIINIKKATGLDLSTWLDYGVQSDRARHIYWMDYNGPHPENRIWFLCSFEQYNKATGETPSVGSIGRITVEEVVDLDDSDALGKKIDSTFMTTFWALYDTFVRRAYDYVPVRKMTVCAMMNNWDENHQMIELADGLMPVNKKQIIEKWHQVGKYDFNKMKVRILRGCKLMNPRVQENIEQEMARKPGESKASYETRVYGFGYHPIGRRRFIYRSAFSVHKKPQPPENLFIIRDGFGIDWGSGDKTAIVYGQVVIPLDKSCGPYIKICIEKEYDNNKRLEAGLSPLTTPKLLDKIIKEIDKVNEKKVNWKMESTKLTRIWVDSAAKQTCVDLRDTVRRAGKEKWIINNALKDPKQGWGILDRQVYFTKKIASGEIRFDKGLKNLMTNLKTLYFVEGENQNKRIEKGYDLDLVNAVEYLVAGLKPALQMAYNRYILKGEKYG